MADYTQDSYYVLSLNILKALGGDTSVSYPDADAIWDEIYKIYDHAGGRFDIVPLEKTITENGQYDYYPENDADAFMPVNISVNIPQKYTDEQVDSLVANATLNGYNDGYFEGNREGLTVGREEGYTEGYTTGNADGIEYQKGKLIDIQIVENGVYESENGYKTVTVEVTGGIPEDELNQMLQDAMDEGYQDGYAEGLDDGFEDGVADQKEKLEEISITANGVYEKEDGYSKVTVKVAGSGDAGKPKIYNGFTLNYGAASKPAINISQLKDIDFSQYDWSHVTDLSYFFGNFNGTFTDADFESFDAHFNGKMLTCESIFCPTTGSNGTITSVPLFLRSRIKDCVLFNSMFYNQRLLTNVNELANWDTKNAISTYQMFYNCSKLTSVPLFDTSNVITMSNMFYTCEALPSVPLFDTSNVTDMAGMFRACYKLTSVPLFDTGNVTDMSNMFYNCKLLTTIPQFDTRNVTVMTGMFQTCSALVTIPELDTSKVINMDSMFNSCSKLESLPLMDTGQLRVLGSFFGYNNITTLTHLGGFKDLGKQSSISGTEGSYFLTKLPNLTKEAVMNVINNLYDRATVGMSVKILKMHANQLAMLTDEDKAIATNKGWTLS